MEISLTRAEIIAILPKVEPGLGKYVWLQERIAGGRDFHSAPLSYLVTMANTRLSESRQRFGDALIYVGAAIALVGWIPVSIWLAPANLASVVTIVLGLLLMVTGFWVVANKVSCPECSASHWIIGHPTRLNCARCGAAYFDDAVATDPAG